MLIRWIDVDDVTIQPNANDKFTKTNSGDFDIAFKNSWSGKSVNRGGSPLEDPRVKSAWTTVGPEPSSFFNTGTVEAPVEKKKKSKKSNISSKQAIIEQEQEIGESLEEND